MGGAGGFTRGLLASLADDQSTHFMFMDDDIDLDPESLFRVITWLSLLRDEHCIAGGMFDQSRPTRLHEAGAARDERLPFAVRAIYDGLDLGDKQTLDQIHAVRDAEYGAWWLWAAPKSAARRLGLALPLFIHADDIELGTRFTAGGVPSHPIPGIGVWHPPFYAKTPEWMFFYDVRNFLILDSLHPKHDAWSVVRSLCGWLVEDLARYEYRRPSLMMAALHDYFAGPEIAFADPSAKHAAVTRLARENAPDAREGAIDAVEELTELR